MIKNKTLKYFRGLLPVKWQLKIEYRLKCKKKLNLKNPKSFSEKIQLYKYKYRNPLLVKCADKSTAPDYVREKGLDHILVKNYGIFDNVEDINFDLLPNSFIIKSNRGFGNNIIVEDKNLLNIKKTKKQLKKWLKHSKRLFGTEWAYTEIKPRIVIERLLPFDKNNDLPDLKFFCFDGEVKFMYIMKDYVYDHTKGKLNFYDRDFNKLPFGRNDFPQFPEEELKKPKNWDLMVEYAEILAKDFPHVRVDFYNIDGDIYFGELTFYTKGGYLIFDPVEYDEIIGEYFNWP